MFRKCTAVLAVVSYLASAGAVRAEPGPVVQWLMGEPASLFDVGILELGRFVRSLNLKGMDVEGTSTKSVSYDWEKNRIEIELFLLGYNNKNEYIDVKWDCKRIINKMRRSGLIDDTTGDFYDSSLRDIENSAYSDYFRHHAYKSSNQPEKYLSRLDHIIELSVTLAPLQEVTSEEYPVLDMKLATKCTGPLLSNKVYFEE